MPPAMVDFPVPGRPPTSTSRTAPARRWRAASAVYRRGVRRGGDRPAPARRQVDLGAYERAVCDVVVLQRWHPGVPVNSTYQSRKSRPAARRRAAPGPWQGTRHRRVRRRTADDRRTPGSRAPVVRPAARRRHRRASRHGRLGPDRRRRGPRTVPRGQPDSGGRAAPPLRSPPGRGPTPGPDGSARSWLASGLAPRPGCPRPPWWCRAGRWRGRRQVAGPAPRSGSRTSAPDRTRVDRRAAVGIRRMTTRWSQTAPSGPTTSAMPRYTSGASRRFSWTSRWHASRRARIERKSRKPRSTGFFTLNARSPRKNTTAQWVSATAAGSGRATAAPLRSDLLSIHWSSDTAPIRLSIGSKVPVTAVFVPGCDPLPAATVGS